MTTEQRIKLNMYLGVRNYGNQNDQVVKNIAKFATTFDKLKSTIDEIQLMAEIQGVNKTGLASDKNRLKNDLIAMAVKNSNKVAILAKQTNNDTLLKEIKFNESQLRRLPEVTLKEQVQIIYERAQANIGNLTEQGITPDTQKAFLDLIAAFNKALATPRTGIAEKTKATQKLIVLYKNADSLLEIMDLAAGSVKDEQPDFFNGYRTSRVLVDANTGALALKGTAKNSVSGEPIHGVVFTFIHEADKLAGGDGIVEISKKTAKKGNFHIKHMPAGSYKVAVSKPGFKTKEVTVTVADGERSELVVELETA
jgi:hypothetical protein